MDVESVESLGAEYRRAAAARDRALAELRGAVRAAAEAGLSKNQIIRLSGLARQTVYDMLR